MERRGWQANMTDERLREIVRAIDGDMAAASKATRDQWTELVALLSLGPSPLLRVCPFCGEAVRQEATRCGYCWNALAPFVEPSTGSPNWG